MGGSRSKYYVRFPSGGLPRVDVVNHYGHVVKRCWGLTSQHALTRALHWKSRRDR
jgi:hypothetical protein